MSPQIILASLVFAVSLGIGQLLFKLAAGDVRSRLAMSWMDAALSPWLLSALALYAASTALWIYILAHAPLSRAYPFALLGAALVPLLARLVLNEPLPGQYLIGMVVVIVGVAMIQLS